MDAIHLSQLILGKKVRCILLLDVYPENKYKQDFEEFLAYQTKKDEIEDTTQVDSKFYKLKNYPYIPYQDFRNLGLQLFSKCIFEIIKATPEIMLSLALNVQVKIFTNKKLDECLVYDGTISTPENICLEIPGWWILQNLVAPYYYMKRINFSYVTKYFQHDFSNHLDRMMHEQLLTKRDYDKKFMEKARYSQAYSTKCLYMTLVDLRDEGLANFSAKKDGQNLEINMKGIREFNAFMKRLSTFRLKKDAEPAYSALSWDNLMPSSSYNAGMYMCITIALSLAKVRKEKYFVVINGQNVPSTSINLDELMSNNDKVIISGLSSRIMAEALDMIRPTLHYYFVRLYESACGNLGISDKNRVMTSHRFYDLVLFAEHHAKKEITQMLKDSGFMPLVGMNII